MTSPDEGLHGWERSTQEDVCHSQGVGEGSEEERMLSRKRQGLKCSGGWESRDKDSQKKERERLILRKMESVAHNSFLGTQESFEGKCGDTCSLIGDRGQPYGC